jgi:hypothetical protein
LATNSPVEWCLWEREDGWWPKI